MRAVVAYKQLHCFVPHHKGTRDFGRLDVNPVMKPVLHPPC